MAWQIGRQRQEHMALFRVANVAPGDCAEQNDVQRRNGRARPRVIHHHRRKHRKDVLVEVFTQQRALCGGKIGVVKPADAFLLHQRHKLLLQNVILPRHKGGGLLVHLFPLLGRGEAGVVTHAQALLAQKLQTADADHEEFIEVRSGDGEKLDALEHGKINARHLVQDT